MSHVVLWSDTKLDGVSAFPNLAIAKIAAHHKAKGDTVSMYYNRSMRCDILYKSKVFSFTEDLDWEPAGADVLRGGSGYAITIDEMGREAYTSAADVGLPKEIESIYPDLSIYGTRFRGIAYGFLTRGCPRNCGYCIVSKKEGRCSTKVADLKDIWRGQKTIKLLDPNLLACKERDGLLLQLANSRAEIDFTQGVDARLVTLDVAKQLQKVNVKMMHFAFDGMKDEAKIVQGLTIYAQNTSLGAGAKKVYILTNYDTTFEEDVYRVKKVAALGYSPYLMIYQTGTHDDFLRHLKRWCNSPYFHSCDFSDYRPNANHKKMYDIYGKITLIK